MITIGTPIVVNSDGTVREAIEGETPFGYALEEKDGVIAVQVKDSSMQITMQENPLWNIIEAEQHRESSDFTENDDYHLFAGENMRTNPVVDEKGTKYWFDEDKNYHRVNGPAIEYYNGGGTWFIHGKKHRINGPAKIFPTGRKEWYQNDHLHREDGPAIENPDGTVEYYIKSNKVSELQWKLIMNKTVEAEQHQIYENPFAEAK